MSKVKTVFSWIIRLIITPLAAIVTIPISDRFISFMTKHTWLKMLISAVIMLAILFFIYFV